MARQYSCADLISNGLLLAGDTSLTAVAVVWLNNWLRSQYAAWAWPFLQKRASGLTIAAGTESKLVGAGSGGVTDDIQSIYDPLYFYTTDRRARGMCRLVNLTGGDMSHDEDMRDDATQRGIPSQAKCRPSSTVNNQFTLIFDPVPDIDYLFSFDYIIQPADEVTSANSGGTAVPMYPNDQTIIQAVKVAALNHMKDPSAPDEDAKLSAMVSGDRIKYGQTPGVNEDWGLNGKTFKGGA